MKTSKLLIKGMLAVAMISSPLQGMAAELSIESDAKLTNELISKLATPVTAPQSLTNKAELNKISEEPRLSFSNTLRRYLQENAIALSNDDKYNAPMVFNPSWSKEKAREMKTERKNYICRQMMEKLNMDAIMKDLKIEAKKLSKSSAAGLSSPGKLPVQNELNQILQRLSKDEKGVGVSQKLGQVVGVDIVHGAISEIHLSADSNNFNDLNTISLSLPMLIGYENVRDYYFVDSVSCLSRLLLDEQRILGFRKDEIENPKIAQQVEERLVNIRQAYVEFSISARKNGKTPATYEAFRDSQLNELANKNDDIAIYLLKKAQYLSKINPGAGELEVINARRADLASVIPYVTVKQLGANFAHKQLRKLSEKQVRELLTLMLELQKNIIPTDKSLKKIEELGHQNDQFAADAVYFKNLNESLDELSMSLSMPH